MITAQNDHIHVVVEIHYYKCHQFNPMIEAHIYYSIHHFIYSNGRSSLFLHCHNQLNLFPIFDLIAQDEITNQNFITLLL